MRIFVVLLMAFGSFASISAICRRPPECALGDWDFELCRCFPTETDPPPTTPLTNPTTPITTASTCAPISGCSVLSAYPTCQCISCVSDPCPPGQFRAAPPNCKCIYICSPPYPAPFNKVWMNYPICDYVCNPTLPPCINGQPRDFNCNCHCATQICRTNQYWSNIECRCVCYPRACLYGRIFNEDTCRCERSDIDKF